MVATVSADAVVCCPAETARTRLEAVLGGAHRHRVRVGTRWVAKRVDATMGGRRELGLSSVADLRWAATGHLGRLFPELDAGVVVTPINATTCLVSITGRYHPPFGPIGRIVDRVALHYVAAATADDFASRLARVLAHDAREGPP